MEQKSLFAAAIAAALALGAAAPAEDEKEKAPIDKGLVERIEVSAPWARDRETPASFTDLDEEEIARENRGQDAAALLAETPNAYAYSDAGNQVGYTYLFLRGFDQRRIAVNINGVPLNTPESRQVYYIDLADLAGAAERIQIQRGPGTALYGSPAVGGVVNVETGAVPAETGGELRFGGGSFGTWRASVEYGGAIGDGTWAWRARLAHVRSDGYRNPSWTRHSFGQIALQRSSPDSVWRILLFGGPEETQLSYFGLPVEYLRGEVSGDPDRDRRVNFLAPGEIDRFVQPQIQILNERRLAPGLHLGNTWYSIVGRGYFRQFSPDFDPLVFDPTGTDPDGAPRLAEAWRKRWVGNVQVGWIPRLTWDHASGSLTVGGEILLHRGNHEGTVLSWGSCTDPAGPDGCAALDASSGAPLLYAYRNTKETYGLFARQTFRPDPRLAVNLEVQATHHRYAMRNDATRGYSFDADYTFVTPRVGANWNVTDAWHVYGQVSTARSEPAFSNVWNPQDVRVNPQSLFRTYDPARRRFADPTARPERLLAYEAGLGWRGERGRIRGNVYWMDFKDELVFAGGLDEDGLPITQNAARSTHRGIEIEGSWRLPGEVDVAGNVAISDDSFEEHRVLSGTTSGPPIEIDYSGNRVALFPEYQARLRASRAFGPARLEVGVRRVGTIYTDNSENERKNQALRSDPSWVDKKVDPFTVWDAKATLDLGRLFRLRGGGSLSADVWIENLLDRRYETFGYSYPIDEAYTAFYTEFFPAASRGVYFGVTYGF